MKVKADSSPISSQVMISRMTDLISGAEKPSTATDQMWLDEMNEIMDAGGYVSVPTDLPDPIDKETAAWHLSLDDDESETKAAPRNPRYDWYSRDGDLDGNVQDGTPFQRRSRSNSHNAIGRRDRRLVRRLRLRDLPFPFTPAPVPPTKPPVVATPEGKSALAKIRSGAFGGRRKFRPAKFNPNAIDGNSDGTVQDGTQFERPAPPRKPRGSAMRSIFSKQPFKPPKTIRPQHEPFDGIGKSDEVRSPKVIAAESRWKPLLKLAKKFDHVTMSESLSLFAPFGGHRSKKDGAHPAIRKLADGYKKTAEEKFGPLETLEQMEDALKKAFPAAEIRLGDGAMYPEKGAIAVMADETFRFANLNLVAAIRKKGFTDEEARQLLLQTQQTLTRGLLALSVERPDVARRVGFVGMTLTPEKQGTLGFVAPDLRDPGKFVMMFDPATIINSGTMDMSEEDIALRDVDYGALVGGNVPKSEKAYMNTSLYGLVSDSDLEAYTTAMLTHEWGHATGHAYLQDHIFAEFEKVAPMAEWLSGHGPIDVKGLPPELQQLGSDLLSSRSNMAKDIDTLSAKLAKKHVDLARRMQMNGIPVPANLAKMSDAERMQYAHEILREAVVAHLQSLLIHVLSDIDGRMHGNPAMRTLGSYSLYNTEEAAAEMYLASKLGIDLTDIVSEQDDPQIHARVKGPS